MDMAILPDLIEALSDDDLVVAVRHPSVSTAVLMLTAPEADFEIRLSAEPSSGRCRWVQYRAAFREPAEAGGTWWDRWSEDVSTVTGGCAVLLAEHLARTVSRSRLGFRRLLDDMRAAV